MERESTGFDIRLKQLELTNFRGFSQLSNLVFNERVTVLISENGGGKTSILDAIAAALKVFANQLLKSEFTRLPKLDPKNIKNGTMNGSIELEIEGKISYIEKIEEIVENDILIEASNEIQDSKNFNSKLQINLNEKDTTPRIDGCEATIESEFEFREVFKTHYRKEIDHLPILVYYGCNSIDTNSELTNHFRESNLFHLYAQSLDAQRFSFDSFLRWFDTQFKISKFDDGRQKTNHNSGIELALIKKVVETILNDDNEVFFDLRMKYAIERDAMVINKRDLVGGFDEIEVDQMSAGEKVMFALSIDIAKRLILANPDLVKEEEGSNIDALHGKGIVLIDEIDLHLHPKWQRRILPKLMDLFPNVQFVVTTHSPFVVQSVLPQNCIRLNNGIPEYFEGEDVSDYETTAIDFFNINDFFNVATSNLLREFRALASQVANGQQTKKDADFIQLIKHLSQKGDSLKAVLAFELSQMENQLKKNDKN